jgi:hypothetical protein
MAHSALKRLLFFRKVLGSMRRMIKNDPRPPLVRPVAEFRMIRGKALVPGLVARLTRRIAHRGHVKLRALMLAMASRTSIFTGRRRSVASSRDLTKLRRINTVRR